MIPAIESVSNCKQIRLTSVLLQFIMCNSSMILKKTVGVPESKLLCILTSKNDYYINQQLVIHLYAVYYCTIAVPR